MVTRRVAARCRHLWVTSLLAVGACSSFSSEEGEGGALASAYADILVREIRADHEALLAARDSLTLRQSEALLWVDWIDEQAAPPSHTLMESAGHLSRPFRVTLRRRVFGELERRAHWSVVPDPEFREELERYHDLAGGLPDMGDAERLLLREHLSSVLEPEEWYWMFDIPRGEPEYVQLKDAVRSLWTQDFRTVMRVVAISLVAQHETIDELVALNESLEARARAWKESSGT